VAGRPNVVDTVPGETFPASGGGSALKEAAQPSGSSKPSHVIMKPARPPSDWRERIIPGLERGGDKFFRCASSIHSHATATYCTLLYCAALSML
jgi:hypothetical protein